MKIAVHPTRQRRLLGLVVLSLLLHLLAFTWFDGWLAPQRAPARGSALALRLAPVPTSPASPAASSVASPAAPPAAPSATSPALETPADMAQIPAHASPATRAGPAAPAVPTDPAPGAAPAALAADAPAPLPGSESPGPFGNPPPGLAPLQMPGRYRVRPPPSARLTYAVTRALPGRPAEPGGSAELAWRLEGGRYGLRVDGILGQFDSEGHDDDAGIAPLRSIERGAAGAGYVTRFDRDAGRVDSGAGSAPLHPGSQDPASVLMQLAGIGLAEPDQMREVIEIVVAGAGGAQVVRFEVLGREELATAAGTLAAVRLAQLGQAGGRRVEIWLAPERNWLPVQLRVTGADGSVANQLVTSIDTTPASAPSGM